MASTDNGVAYEPTHRRGSALVEYNGLTYMVGGVKDNSQPFSLSAVEVFDPTSLKWQQWETTGEIPERIFFSAYTTVKQCIYFFGGGFQRKQNNTLWCLNLESMLWTCVHQTNVPSPRNFGGLVSDGERLVLFGGQDPSNRKHTDVNVFSIKDGECCGLH